jgi:endonuclease/exonuclease/phosphatase family metal-dependent hydrolase
MALLVLYGALGWAQTVAIASYNVENLFDGVDDGTEYPEYDSGTGAWDEARFKKRVELVGRAIKAIREGGPDILVLIEVESKRALDALADGPLAPYGYSYRLVPRAPGSAANVAILSRHAPIRAQAHAVETGAEFSQRYILELEFLIGGRPLVVFANHWKSKTGGAEDTEPKRRAQAALLAERVRLLLASRPSLDIVACGDFNEEPDEYEQRGGRYATALRPAASVADPARARAATRDAILTAPTAGISAEAARLGQDFVLLASPWLDPGHEGRGSYRSGARWERIDGFLLSQGLMDAANFSFASFKAIDAAFLLSSSGKPLRWDGKRLSGYSDHLPILLELSH